MKTELTNGKEHESKPAIMELMEGTQHRLVLYAIRDALQRLNFACKVVIHTESAYVASVFDQGWLAKWSDHGWRTSKGEEVKDSVLWSQILQEIEENGHDVTAVSGKHEFSEWMHWKIELAHGLTNGFSELKE